MATVVIRCLSDQLFPDRVNGRLTKGELLIENQVQGFRWNVPEILLLWMTRMEKLYRNTRKYKQAPETNQSISQLLDYLIPCLIDRLIDN